MKPKLIVLDWNGTLITDVDDKPVLKQIAMDELWYSLRHPFLRRRQKSSKYPLSRFLELALMKGTLDGMIKRYRDAPDIEGETLMATYDIFSSIVVPGIPMSRVRSSVNSYSSEYADRLDDSFWELHTASEKTDAPVIILTSAYDLGVTAIMLRRLRDEPIDRNTPASLPYPGFWVDGSVMLEDYDVAMGVELRNHDKTTSLETKREEFKPDKLVYMGDDFRDMQCMETGLIDIFVVPPLATDDFRQHMASKYGKNVRTPKRGEVYEALTMD